MDLFKGLFGFITGNFNELDKPIFAKPYIDKSYDLLELARRLDQAPEESKPHFREAMESMAAKIKTHQRINDLLVNSNMPLLILYDLHIKCDAGEANIDFAVLTNRFITAISCPTQEKEFGASSEQSAYILTEILSEECLVNKKNLQIVRPMTISPESPGYLESPESPESSDKGNRTSEDKKKSGSSLFSETYPKIHRNIFVKPDDFLAQLKLFFRMDDDFCWLTNHELFTISDALLEYDKNNGHVSKN